MPSERHMRPEPRERTFAEVFPWRNIRRALMLVVLIVAIVMIKRSAGPLLARMGDMWGQPTSGSMSNPTAGSTSTAAAPPPSTPTANPDPTVPSGGPVHKIRLGPGLAPKIPPTDTPAR